MSNKYGSIIFALVEEDPVQKSIKNVADSSISEKFSAKNLKQVIAWAINNGSINSTLEVEDTVHKTH